MTIDRTVKRIEELFALVTNDSELERRTGVHRPMISRYRNGVQEIINMQMSTAKKLEDYYFEYKEMYKMEKYTIIQFEDCPQDYDTQIEGGLNYEEALRFLENFEPVWQNEANEGKVCIFFNNEGIKCVDYVRYNGEMMRKDKADFLEDHEINSTDDFLKLATSCERTEKGVRFEFDYNIDDFSTIPSVELELNKEILMEMYEDEANNINNVDEYYKNNEKSINYDIVWNFLDDETFSVEYYNVDSFMGDYNEYLRNYKLSN